MNCDECGAELIEGAKFCSKCGDSVGDRDVGTVAPAIRHLFRLRRTLPVLGGTTAILAVAVVILVILILRGGDSSDPSGELSEPFSKLVSVSVSLEGAPPPGFEAGIPMPDADAVLVTGTEDGVMLVTQAVAKVDLSGRTEDTTQAVPLEPRDSRGFPVEGVSLEPSVIKVSVDIEQTDFSRAFVVSPTVVGAPQAGYDIVSLSSDPQVVTVFGPQSFIGEAATIRTQPIDVTGATSDIVRTVSLDLPPDVRVSGGTSVTVTIQIEPTQGRQTLTVPVVAVGIDPDLSVKGSLPLIEVVLLGELPYLQELRPNDIAATINLTGLREGTHTVSVSVSVPAEASVASVSPEEVEITLEKR